MKLIYLLQWVELLLYLLLIIGHKLIFAIMRCVSVDKMLFTNFSYHRGFCNCIMLCIKCQKASNQTQWLYSCSSAAKSLLSNGHESSNNLTKKKAESDHATHFIFLLYSYSVIIQYFPGRPNLFRLCRVTMPFMMHGYAQKNWSSFHSARESNWPAVKLWLN